MCSGVKGQAFRWIASWVLLIACLGILAHLHFAKRQVSSAGVVSAEKKASARNHGALNPDSEPPAGTVPSPDAALGQPEAVSPSPEPLSQASSTGNPEEAGIGGMPAMPRHPSDALLEVSQLANEKWSDPDAAGNRERVAIYRTEHFKYPWLRVVEKWSGKSGEMDSRQMMVADHLMLSPRAGQSLDALEQMLGGSGLTVRGRHAGRYLLAAFERGVENPDELPRQLAALEAFAGELDSAEPDYLVWPCVEPQDPAFLENKLWGLHNRGEVYGYAADADIDAPEAWEIRREAPGVIVAVTDTGIGYDHEDLAANMWINPHEVAGNGIDDDQNGVIDDVFGYDAVSGDGDPADDHGHGTHCAGTIGARGANGVGTVGVAWRVQLMGAKFLGAYGGTTSDAIKAIDYSRSQGAHVISASWGGGAYSSALYRTIADCAVAGIPFVAAAGNDGTDNDSYPHYPSSYNLPNIVAVAATDARDQLTGFSCYGRTSVDIAAPGWQIWSASHSSSTAYRFLQGTSMATPHVSGALALARAQFPSDEVDELIARLYRSAEVLPALESKLSSGGRLNLQRLLSASDPVWANDSFDTPVVFEGSFDIWSGNNREATREADEGSYSPAEGTRTLWYSWQAPADGFVTVTADSLGAGQRLVVFRGDSRSGLVVLDQSGSAEEPGTVLHFTAEAGVRYRIVAASSSAGGEMFNVMLEATPANDLFSQAAILTGGNFVYEGSNRGATAQPFELGGPHAGVGGGHSLWFRWTAPASGLFSIDTDGSSTDTVLAIYTGNQSSPETLSLVGSNDDSGPLARWSRMDFQAVANTVYHIAVDSAMGAAPGSFVLRGLKPGPPSITSQPQSLEVLPGGRAVLSVGAAGVPALRYQWFRDGEEIAGAWDRRLVIDPVRSESYGTYHVTVRNGFGLVTSAPATLSEKIVAPEIVWSSGNQSAVEGDPVTLRIEARGSEPLVYEWRFEGTLIEGAGGAALTIPVMSQANVGVYECRVINAMGNAKTKIALAKVTSPFALWQYRLGSMPGPGITDIRVIDGKCYAVAGDRVMVSSDGLNWNPWLLPAGFEGVQISKLGSRWLCSGMNFFSSGRCAISLDGVNWTLHTPAGLTGEDGNITNPLQHVTLIEVFNGRFLARVAKRGQSPGIVVTSTDGISWTNALVDGTTTFLVDGRFAVAGNMVVAAHGAAGAPFTPAKAYRSQDGINWSTFTLPLRSLQTYSSSHGAARWNGLFVLFGSAPIGGGGWTSPDGINWTLHDGNAWSGGIDVNGDFVCLGPNEFSVAWSQTPWLATKRAVQPAGKNGAITASAAFNGYAVYGTSRGELGRIAGPDDLVSQGDFVEVPTQIFFADQGFYAVKNSVPIGNPNTAPLVSGDGTHWRPMRRWVSNDTNRVAAYPVVGHAAGKFWGQRGGGQSGPSNGLLPHVMPEAAPVPNGLPSNPDTMVADGDHILATSNRKLYRSTNGGAAWNEVTTAPVLNGSYNLPPRVIRPANRWLLTNGAATQSYEAGFVHYSADGTTWTKTNGKPGFIVPFKGKLYGLEANIDSLYGSVKGWQSQTGGVTWNQVNFHSVNKLADMEVKQLGSFGDHLVALVNLVNHGQTALYFSLDGIEWFRANTPRGLLGFATGLDQFVGYTGSGAIVQVGSAHAGGAAPVVKAAYPIHFSSAIAGSWVDVTGDAFDPEGAPTTVECRVDGRTVGTSAAGAFHFRFRAADPGGHVVQLRATDASGLVGTDELKVAVLPPLMPNQMEAGEGVDYLPRVALVEFNGSFYAAGPSGIIRSRDGLVWEQVLLPSLTANLVGLAAGNGSLVAQTSWGALIATRDGVNWVQVAAGSGAGHRIGLPITFVGGRFFIVQKLSGQNTDQYHSSINGLDWQMARSQLDVYQSTVGDNGVIVSFRNAWSIGVRNVEWSADGGNNWKVIPGVIDPADPFVGHSLCYGGGLYLIVGTNGRTWRSLDGKVWTEGDFPAELNIEFSFDLKYVGDRFFVSSGPEFLYSSRDGIAWEALEPAVKSHAIAYSLGRYVAPGNGAMMWSDDGVVWHQAEGGPIRPIAGRIAANASGFLAIDEQGAAWSSVDGLLWLQTFQGIAQETDIRRQTGTQIVTLGDSMLAAGYNGMFRRSTDDGVSWQPVTVNGALVPSTWQMTRLRSSNGVALALVTDDSNQRVLRSNTGMDWQPIPSLDSSKIVDVASDGNGTWLALGSAGALLKSVDNAATWQPVQGPVLATARVLARFKNEWLIFGATVSGGASRTWTSGNAIAWTDRGANGLTYSDNSFFSVEAHGSLVVWNRNDVPVITTDARTWQPFRNHNASLGNINYWVAPSASGFRLGTSFLSEQTPARLFDGDSTGQSWTQIPSFQNDTLWGASLNNRLFLFSGGRVIEWRETDLELELQTAASATLGVGDFVECPALIRNPGNSVVPAPLEVDGWLSSDGFFGDGNDVYLGRITLSQSAPAPGAETAATLRFELPGTIRPGGARLVVVLDPDQKIMERNRPNNVSISSSAFINIPQHRLTMLANGNGTVSSDQMADYYPHGARVAFVARAGNGARFAGWGGDAVGAMSEVLIVMDGNKTVQANFVSTVALSISTRGGGTVERDGDGIYLTGTTVQLKAVPAPGWTFAGWKGDLTGSGSLVSLPMNTNKVVTATFALDREAWSAREFSAAELADPGISGPDADPDGDGLANWREWLRGSKPKDGKDRGQGVLRREGRWMVLSYSRMEVLPEGASVRCQGSTDLSGWESPVDERVIGSSLGVETIEARVDVSQLHRAFLRIEDKLPPQ